MASVSFTRTLRALGTDRFAGAGTAMVIAVVAIGGWLAWFVLARVDVVATSLEARVAVERSVHPVVSVAAGRAVRSELALGRRVEAGDALVVLDSTEEELRLDERRARTESLERQIEAIEREIAARRDAHEASGSSDDAALRASELEHRTAELAAELAAEELARLERLGSGGVSESDVARARLESQRAAADVERTLILTEKLGVDVRRAASEREAAIDALVRERERLAGELAAVRADARSLENAVRDRVLTAPADGEIADAVDVAVGTFVERGAPLGAIVSSGRLAISADFAAGDAVGRIRPGSPAHVTFVGFPRAEYGELAATVRSVGTEAQDGRVRVELDLDDPGSSVVPVQHGMPVRVEVVVERASPLDIVLASSGRARPVDGVQGSGAARSR
ncbi:MAG: HlyD family efflux transporter periplasmic adaptor subunit [Planctomycetota bacterium]